ncbi:MAG TPA: thiamine biosynthesis protein ThiS [Lachnospiraceae bacterium]|uniref:sulfur carrier protein ThiS n=1 Tax=Anaerosporobacter sp. TaxID=1872529 RepID=UPI000EF036E4|nr:sulfur carrier protein ThiS [Anaerosporobacter sp.]HAB60412.1 thiamine biosynthesis protein ThiS [Lachnospiraceae bacterium]
MNITVAGKKTKVEEGISIAKLIEVVEVENPLYVTVSVNEDFVDSKTYDETILKENDSVEFLYFMGGGSF